MCTVFVAPVMGFTVLFCFLTTVLAPCFSAYISKEVAYECGPHGKFEYCIGENPSCVIGCHCHPGYYFDTDTKICEPNVKLTQHFRQHYLAEPTPTATVYPTPTTTTTVYNDNQDQGVTKDTDELGDWLYNQFFKTIESQVINNSNNTKSNNNNEKPPTRRSGGGRVISKSKKKTRKSSRSRKKRKHMKGHGLRRKLLRITEDDSLFDSGSDSDDDSVSSSSESDSSSDSSADIESSDEKKSKSTETETDGTDCPDDKDHGHKKVIIFNKRPKPPLPSFIFLPSMDTPYYPPIGLPPPPLVPMYPMVPVPPMPPPYPIFPEHPNCNDESSKATTTTTEGSVMTTVEPTTTTTDHATTDHTTTQEHSPGDEDDVQDPKIDPPIRRNPLRRDQTRTNLENFIMRSNKSGKQNKLKHGQHNQLMQKLRHKLKGKRRNSKTPTHTEKVEEIQDEDLQNINDISDVMEDDTPYKQSHTENHIPKLDDVDFKYLSELIHRVNQSRSSNRHPLPFDLNNDLKELQKLQLSQPTRRIFDSHKPALQAPRQGADEMYYSNLGRQIAAMIRNADSTIDHQFMKDSGHKDPQLPVHYFLTENGGPKSFWERSVRSPVPQKGSVFVYLDPSRTLKYSNEKSLINLENEVKIFASTPPPLRLQDLENILSTIHKAHAQIEFRQPTTSTKQSNESLNVNLLPKHVRSTYSKLFFDAPEKIEYITERYQTPSPAITPLYAEMHPAVTANASVFHEPEIKYNVPYSDYWMFNPVPIQSKAKPRSLIGQSSKPIMNDSQMYYRNPVQQPFLGVLHPTHNDTKKLHVEHLQSRRNEPLITQTTSKSRRSKVVKYKSLNYFSGNKHLMFEAASYPFLSPFKTQPVSKRIFNSKPSYFHQQSHRFEYFD